MRPSLRSALHYVPTISAFVVLGGLAVWGHRTGWKLTPRTAVASAEKEDWCEAHNVPDSRCLACHPELGGGNPADWCKEHGVPESKCATCHPEILTTGQAKDWCREHNVPESACTTCHPDVAVRSEEPPTQPEVQVVPDKSTKADPSRCQTHAIRVQFASPEAVRKAGVVVRRAETRPMVDALRAPGEIDYDRTRLAKLAPRVTGTLWAISAGVGDQVVQGQLLALIDSAEVGRAKAAMVEALARLDVSGRRLGRLKGSGSDVVMRATLEDAEAQAREARVQVFNAEQALANLGLRIETERLQGLDDAVVKERLRFLGIPQDRLQQLGKEAVTTANLLPLQAPFGGVVISRDIVQGEVVDPQRPLLAIADLSRMWVTLNVPAEDQARIALNQRVTFRPDGADFAVTGQLSWIATAIDEKTRTLQVRAVLDNAEGALRAGAFGTARIAIRESPEAVVVPDAAIHWEGCCNVVFVRLADDIFQTRKVRLGARNAGFTEITVGVVAGEVVAAEGSYVLKSELLKSKLGAGCVDD